MAYLFVDTETSGLPDFKLPPDHPSQPHIVSLAAWLGDWDDDTETVTHVASLNAMIAPDGYHFDPGAVAVHGITEEYARAFGEPARDVLDRFLSLVNDASTDSLGMIGVEHGQLIAHNTSFDHRMLLRELSHANMPVHSLGLLRPFCTMKALTPRMKLPPSSPRAPRGSFKWPKLDEAYEYMFNKPVPGREDRHDAMADCLGCKDIYEEGKRREWWR